ncbi:glycoside hydrolase N-terminal domain-containing protein [Arenibacter sp. ARW7G5Y1]|uniref:glycoside hydrolase family 95 protein n=1 Tax=Arenibacter sp. ARW7G5Y1 TaxID=2135619 RepID=UPI000D764001|nr:glycoside hydrolase family 95 protein [Arenibacter sp. ARW7G5Y1]PXX23780.1 alpha-L-fucosidase 2 [Arenibacter sp. ARW7G5Y1]
MNNKIMSFAVLFRSIVLVLAINISCTNKNNEGKVANSFKVSKLRQFEVTDNEPAQKWEHAYPIGNGRLGAMPFGGFPNEQILLNEETIWQGRNSMQNRTDLNFIVKDVRELLWAGKYEEAQNMINKDLLVPRITPRAFQPLGYLRLNYKTTLENSVPKTYSRKLSMNDALAVSTYELNDGNSIKQEVFVSHPDNIIAIRIESKNKGALSLSIGMDRFADFTTEPVNANTLVMWGQAQNSNSQNKLQAEETTGKNMGTRFHAMAKVITEEGKTVNRNNEILVEGAKTITILISSSTDYNYNNPFLTRRHDRLKACLNTIIEAEKHSYKVLKDRHIKDHQAYFERATIDLGETAPGVKQMTTSERLKSFNNGGSDPDLLEDLFQMGRYMLIASSRKGTLPPNLTGIWNGNPNPANHSDWHTNINVQQNFWHAELTNLSDLHEPFISLINDIRLGQGKQLAEKLGCRGFLITHATHAWKEAAFSGHSFWGMWPMGGAWSVSHVMEHYRFTNDKDYLSNMAYPILRDNVLFCLDWLVENPQTGKLVSGPSASPENGFYVDGSEEIINACMGPTVDQMIIYESFTDFLEASEILKVNNELTAQITEAREKLAKPQIGLDGRIMEWDKEYREWKVNHRHYSHLYSLYPGCEIMPNETPALFEAARISVQVRQTNGGVSHGWSRGHLLNLYARLLEGEKAYETLQYLMKNNTLPNLMHTQPPIFFDGNGAGTAGMVEMLLQSHGKENILQLLPALPKGWQTGSFEGLCARGAFEIDLKWKEGKPLEAIVLSKSHNQIKIKEFPEMKISVSSNGKAVKVKRNIKKGYVYFDTVKGQYYHLQFK